MPPDKGKSVFIGNIPFNLTEEEIKHLLSQAGQVTKFRLMTNPDTGKPKGFGFADFLDADSAASAVRNLNDFEINGRKIRVDWPHNNEKDSVPTNYDESMDGGNGQAGAPSLPPLPPGVDLPPNLKCTDAISQTLNTLPPAQLLDVLTQMKSLAMTDPARATELLKAAPQLSYAIFQALILMNLVDSKVLASVVEQTMRPNPAANVPPPQQQVPPPQPPQQQQYQGYPPPSMPNQRPIPTPQPQYAPPPPQQQMVPPPQAAPTMSQEEMLRQVLQMDQRTIDSLPPTERMQIMQLRQQMGVR